MEPTGPKVVAVPGVFTRASSGLVRQVSTSDTVYYGAMAITIAYMVFIVVAWPAYPGSSMVLSTLLVMVGGTLLGVVYALFASIYPRSGGEYVFLSRVVHPSVGFVISFIQSFWYAFYFGLNGAFFAIYGLAPLFVALGSNVIYSSRAMLAWGLDGVAPAPFANVSERRHTPVFAIVTLVVLAEVALAIFTYTTLVEILSGFLGFAIAFLVVCLAGIFFPFTHRETLERSPSNIKVAGMPLMTVCGVLATPFIAFIAYRTATDKALGANAHISLIVNGILIAIGFAWFYALRWYRKSRGVDVDRRFKEIPIE